MIHFRDKKLSYILAAMIGLLTITFLVMLNRLRFQSQPVKIIYPSLENDHFPDIKNKKEIVTDVDIIKYFDQNNSAGEQNKESHKIDINTADLKTFMALPGIGIKLAEAIIKYRENNGRFNSEEDIMLVSGIGKNRFETIHSLLKPFGSKNSRNASQSANKKNTEGNKTFNNNSLFLTCPYCKSALVAGNSRNPHYKPYCTNCLKYLYTDKQLLKQNE